MTPQQYLSDTDKLFESKLLNLGVMLEKKDETIIKSFLHERQIGLIEVVKSLVPEEQREYSFDNQYFPECRGFNSCREQIIKNLEK